MGERVTAREIIQEIIKNMYEEREPLLYATLVPSRYDIYLHTDDHEQLKSLFPRIKEEARKALEEELYRLNRGTWLLRILRLLPLLNEKVKERKYERGGDGWSIGFFTDEEADKGDIGIDSRFDAPPSPKYGSDIERTITWRSGGKTTKTIKTTYESPTESTDRVFARLGYEDDNGKQVYSMTKNQIVIGRGGTGYWVDLKLSTQSNVSREHVCLRRDKNSGKFFIKDSSTFGTTVNGEIIPTSVETVDGEKQDKDVWVPLPSKARIGLANAVFLDFEAL